MNEPTKPAACRWEPSVVVGQWRPGCAVLSESSPGAYRYCPYCGKPLVRS